MWLVYESLVKYCAVCIIPRITQYSVLRSMYCESDNSTGNNPHGTEQMAALLWQDWSLIWCSGIKFVFRLLKVWQELVCSLLVEYLYSSWQCYPPIGQQDVPISMWVACCWVCLYFLLWRTYKKKGSIHVLLEIFNIDSGRGEEREEKKQQKCWILKFRTIY